MASETNSAVSTPTGILTHDAAAPGRSTPAQVRNLLGTTDADRVKFFTSDVAQAVDVSDVDNYCVLRTGSGWTAPRNITFNGTPPSRGRMLISNNSGQTISLVNGTGSPIDFPTMPMEIADFNWVELVVSPATSKLLRVARGLV